MIKKLKTIGQVGALVLGFVAGTAGISMLFAAVYALGAPQYGDPACLVMGGVVCVVVASVFGHLSFD